jgi:predicted XRE-type DNA-binding protein
MANNDIRETIKQSALKQWQVAERFGLNEGNFSRLLRRELKPSQKTQILEIIKDLAVEHGGVGHENSSNRTRSS